MSNDEGESEGNGEVVARVPRCYEGVREDRRRAIWTRRKAT